MSIAKKLHQAQLFATEVEKTAKNGHHNYFYATADSIVACGKQALNNAGLALVNTGYFVDREKSVVKATFWLLDTDGDEKLELSAEMPFVASQGRPDDKAVSASLTELRGYLMLGLLQIERIGQDVADVAGRDDSQYQPSQSYQSRSQATRQDHPQQQQQAEYSDLGNCRDCGAPNKWSQKSNKPYCSAKCWDKKPATNGSRF
jgi:hypothetical protein